MLYASTFRNSSAIASILDCRSAVIVAMNTRMFSAMMAYEIQACRRISASSRPMGMRSMGLLSLHRDALRQVPRLIHVAPASQGDVVREELRRNDGEDGLQGLDRPRNFDVVVRQCLHRVVAFVADHDQLSVAGL